ALKNGGFACVYVAAVPGGETCRVGYADELAATVTRLQRSSPLMLSVESAIWVPDRGIAKVIANEVGCDLAPHRQSGGWFNVAAAIAVQAVELATFRLYPNATTVPHHQLISQMAGNMRRAG
ncbi:MAG: hypothetical protein G4V63_24510, partial [Candidatus Afipia apatlaquensis]|nr:hypothetical protein [Candidatus Afipia apatlaquensis]